jgi:hypothetical protein
MEVSKTMRYIKALPLLTLALMLCVGCGPKKPAGIPDLYPTTIKVLKSGSPVADANVILVPASGTASGSWSVAGMTDSSGVATIETSQGDWKAPGAPEGEYDYYITKLAKIEEPEPPSDMDSDEGAKEAYYAERLKRLEAASTEIPKALNSTSTSELSVTVAAGSGGTAEVDVDDYAE